MVTALAVPLPSAWAALAASTQWDALALENGASSALTKSACLSNCSSGVFGVCIMHSCFNNLMCNFICFHYDIRPQSLYFIFLFISVMCAFAFLL